MEKYTFLNVGYRWTGIPAVGMEYILHQCPGKKILFVWDIKPISTSKVCTPKQCSWISYQQLPTTLPSSGYSFHMICSKLVREINY